MLDWIAKWHRGYWASVERRYRGAENRWRGGLEDMTYRSDYPNEPIGDGNPYYRCCGNTKGGKPMTQFKTFTEAEKEALILHGLDTHQPSQLSDCFVLGMRYTASQSEADTRLWSARWLFNEHWITYDDLQRVKDALTATLGVDSSTKGGSDAEG